jgi:hypothetical protein
VILSFTARELAILKLLVVMGQWPDFEVRVTVYCLEIWDFKTPGTMVLMAIFYNMRILTLIQWNLDLSFPDNSFSRICRSISMVPERILFKLWLPDLFFSRIHCFFFRPPTKTMNRGITVL